MSKKNLILRAALLVILTGMIAVAVSLAWFSVSTRNDLNEFTIEVGSADTFELSLDGINYNRQMNIKLFNNDNYNGVELADLTGVYEEIESDNNVVFKSLKLFNPLRDEYEGTPLTSPANGFSWTEAIKTKVIYSGNSYYVISTDDDASAQYVELDLWIRSDSNLEIYLGDESKISPVTTTSDSNVIPAMFSRTETHYDLVTNTYKYGNGDVFMVIYIDKDGYHYYFDENDDFVIKFKEFEINNNTYKYFYDENNHLLIKSRDIYNNNEYQYTVYYASNDSTFSTVLFRTEFTIDGNFKRNVYKDESGGSLTQQQITALDLDTMVSDYIEIGDLETGYAKVSDTVNEYSDTTFYDENGEFIVRKHQVGNVVTYYDDENVAVDPNGKEYMVIVPSNYGKTYYTLVNDLVPSTSISQTFSKNLVAGATLVSFSEMVTDTFESETKEVENLKYIWNPLPSYGLTSNANDIEQTFSVDNERTELINYYTCEYDDVTNSYAYTLANWAKEVDDVTKLNSLIRTGNIRTTDKEVLNYETPLCTTVVEQGNKFCVKKMRIKIWIDGNDVISQNSMLNSSAAGNGQISVSLKLVSNVNQTIVEATEVSNGIYELTASKINGAEETYNWSVSGSWWTHDHLARFDIATLSTHPDYPSDTSKKYLTFNQVGTVTVYATDSQGRVGALVITYDFATIDVSYTPNTNVYEFSLVGASNQEKAAGDWYISNNVIASLEVDNDTKVATVTFNSSGTVRISFMITKQIENVTYDVEVYYDIVHTFVGSGD